MTINSIAKNQDMQELLPLTDKEQAKLIECEQIIERGFKTFMEVGTALLEIRDSRLYRHGYRTFEDYCRGRWNLERRRSYQLMDAASVALNVKNFSHEPPKTESHAAPLAKLEPEVQREVWRDVTESTPSDKITAKTVEEKAKEAQELNEAVKEVKARSNDELSIEGEVVARGEKEIMEAAKAIRARKAEESKQKNEALKAATKQIEMPADKYKTIIIDPPWPMQKIERDVRPNQVDFDYPTMTEDELSAMNIPAADECHLYLWTTQRFLPLAFRLLDRWEFRYIFTMVWRKPGGPQPFGLPQYNCEFVLFGRKGSLGFLDTKAFPTCFDAPRREHSRKPDQFYDLIRRVSPGPRIDMFSRQMREGFDQFGNETDKFAEVSHGL